VVSSEMIYIWKMVSTIMFRGYIPRTEWCEKLHKIYCGQNHESISGTLWCETFIFYIYLGRDPIYIYGKYHL